MKRFKKSAVVLAVLATVLASACGGPAQTDESGPVTLRFAWWGNAERAALMQKAIEVFQRKHPNIKVTPSFQEFEAYWQKIATETAGGNAPDVFQMDFVYLREYADRNVLYDLKKQEGAQLQLDDLVDGLKGAGEIKGKLFGVPVGGNTWGFMYNPALFRQAGVEEPKAGWTWSDYRRGVEQITQRTGVHGSESLALTYYNLELRLLQEGKSLYTEEGKLGFDKARLKAFLEDAKAQADTKSTLPIDKVVQTKPRHPLEADLTASALGWDNFLARYAGNTKAEIKLGPAPSDHPQVLGQYVRPAMLLSASQRTAYPASAAKLVSFMINDPEAGKIFAANRGLPPTNAQRDAVTLDGPLATVAKFQDSLKGKFTKTPPAPPKGAGTLEQTFMRITEELLYNRISVDAAVDRFFTEADETLGS
ncbi:ABC transporter substrate-binding protein [Crossiella sp. NPDC003009]